MGEPLLPVTYRLLVGPGKESGMGARAAKLSTKPVRRRLIMQPVITMTTQEAGLERGEWPASIELKDGRVYRSPEFRIHNGCLIHVTYFCGLQRLVITSDGGY